MYRSVHIKQHEIGLRFRKGEFAGILGSGNHRFLALPGRQDHPEVFNRLDSTFYHPLLEVLVEHVALANNLTVMSLAQEERAIVWRNGVLFTILGPGLHAFWNKPARIEIETFSVNDFVFEHPRLDSILASPMSSNFFTKVSVTAHERVLLMREGNHFKTLKPGLYAYWKGSSKVSALSVDIREETLDVGGQEIMTSDKVTLRLNLTLAYRVCDVELAAFSVQDYKQALYREAQLALRATVGTRTLEQLLSDKEAVGNEVAGVIEKRVLEFGVAVKSAGIRDIILPGDMKDLLNQVTEAQKAAEANIIKRREETAAARSQANTAKLLADNPTLMRLKELEVIQEILANAKTVVNLGSGNLQSQLRSLISEVTG